jgi:drug/metabolite transporter (DMT)-like permease
MSGVGFSIQALIIKLLEEGGFSGSFIVITCRGFIQTLIASIFVYNNTARLEPNGPKLFGNTWYARAILFSRTFFGYGGICFTFLAIEKLPVGDATVLVMIAPIIAAAAGYFILGEAFRVPEFVGLGLSMIGVVLVARPPFIFHSNDSTAAPLDHLGVILALCASISAGFAYVSIRMLGSVFKMPWENVVFAQGVTQIVFSVLPVFYLQPSSIADLTFVRFLLICTAGTIGAFSQLIMTIGMQREKSARASAMRMSDVLASFLFQQIFTSDSVSDLSIVGALLIVASVMVIVLFKDKSATPEVSKSASGVQLVTAYNPLDTTEHGNELDNDGSHLSALEDGENHFTIEDENAADGEDAFAEKGYDLTSVDEDANHFGKDESKDMGESANACASEPAWKRYVTDSHVGSRSPKQTNSLNVSKVPVRQKSYDVTDTKNISVPRYSQLVADKLSAIQSRLKKGYERLDTDRKIGRSSESNNDDDNGMI